MAIADIQHEEYTCGKTKTHIHNISKDLLL